MEKFQCDTKTRSALPFNMRSVVGSFAQPCDKSLICECSLVWISERPTARARLLGCRNLSHFFYDALSHLLLLCLHLSLNNASGTDPGSQHNTSPQMTSPRETPS